MATTYRREGNVFTHSVAEGGARVNSDDVVVSGTLAGVSLSDIEPGSSGEVAICGVFTIAARTGVTFVQGEALAWDVSTSKVIKSSAAAAGDIDGFGKAMDEKPSAQGTVDVLITVQSQAVHA